MIYTLNLIYPERSDIKYNIITFSDSETHIDFEPIDRKGVDYVEIKTRISSINDLFILQQAADVLNRQGIPFNIVITYLLGMRMDRIMTFERPYTLSIISNVINGLGAVSVNVIEPHSHKTTELIHNCYSVGGMFSGLRAMDFKNYYTIVFPDAGAEKRYADYFDSPNDYIVCSKVRDVNTGKIVSFKLDDPNKVYNSEKPLLIIDDLCDGGGTFVGVAKMIREINPEVKLSIAVTHAVNKVGIDNMSANFDEVYITNTYKDWENLNDNVTVVSIVD